MFSRNGNLTRFNKSQNICLENLYTFIEGPRGADPENLSNGPNIGPTAFNHFLEPVLQQTQKFIEHAVYFARKIFEPFFG